MRIYAAEWLAFAAWCRTSKRSALPADADTLAAYLLAVAPGATRGTIGRKRAAIRAMHRQHGLPLPALDKPARRAVRQAAAPKLPSDRRQVRQPRSLWIRLAMQCPRDLAGSRDRALLLLAACEQTTGEELLGLEHEQIRIVEPGVELRLSRLPPVIVSIPRQATASCPVRALEDWLRESATSFGPVFRKVDRWGNVEHARLGPDGLRRIVERRTAGRGRSKKAT